MNDKNKTDISSPYLDCFQMQSPAPKIVPGNSRRKWMDETGERFAYRCLPLTMANSTGWDILCPFDIEIAWNGGKNIEDLKISSPIFGAHVPGFALSHFSSGIATFHTGYLFRTPPGWAVMCTGSPNQPKDGIYALSGLVETDWLPFPFTMNWKMTRPGVVKFKKGESFCFVTLVQHMRLENTQPTIRDLDKEPKFRDDYMLWQSSRADFLKKLDAKDEDTVTAGWQRHYMQGHDSSGESTDTDHKTKRRLKKPVRE